ncbi:hypothetical protein E2C01_037655 [Portunus trituberculatus]|uniref:Uncharacterized protein n=1 Tax=Portunus trituberculatus TaxID=210409 RepID=A0A5B7FHL4_PORTR|nr:hypothetical protein [Portunus trituberculatus]
MVFPVTSCGMQVDFQIRNHSFFTPLSTINVQAGRHVQWWSSAEEAARRVCGGGVLRWSGVRQCNLYHSFTTVYPSVSARSPGSGIGEPGQQGVVETCQSTLTTFSSDISTSDKRQIYTKTPTIYYRERDPCLCFSTQSKHQFIEWGTTKK